MIDHLRGVEVEVTRIFTVIDDLDARVPSCPQWRVRDLLEHLGSVYRLFRRVADEGWLQRPPEPGPDDRPAADDDRIVDWTWQQAELLVHALARLAPEAPRWNFSPGPQVGAFIPRRMHHESVLHRWDLEGAYGRQSTIADDVALDGTREYLEVYLPRSGPWPHASCTVHTAVDDGPTLELDLVEGGLATLHEPPRGAAALRLAGSPEQLLLAWWGRRPLSALLEAGDRAQMEAVRRFAYT